MNAFSLVAAWTILASPSLALADGQTMTRGSQAMTVTKSSDRTTVVTRSFSAIRQKVFDALTKQDQVPRWFKSEHMPLVAYESDVRTGGSFRYVFQRPSGKKMEMRGVYQEVDAPRRWVHTETYDFSPIELLVTVVLEEDGEKTIFRQMIQYASQEARDGDFDSVASSAQDVYAKLENYLTSGK